MIICHGYPTIKLARKYGWLPGARYTNLRDVRRFKRIGLVDIDWKNYSFQKHIDAICKRRPHLTVARDIVDINDLDEVLKEAAELSKLSDKVILVPKDSAFVDHSHKLIPKQYLLGYSVPTKYGNTEIDPTWFANRPVHLLGGRPDVQFKLANLLNVYSLDGNRITLDATFGDYFVGDKFQPHPKGGYYECVQASLKNIRSLWNQREPTT